MHMKGILTIAAFAASAGLANAEIYSQTSDQPGNPSFFSDGIEGQFFNQTMADNFTLSSGATADQLRWWGGSQNFQFADLTNMTDYAVNIYASDMSGAPDLGSVVYSDTVGAGNARLDIDSTGATLFGGGEEYQYTLDMTSAVSLDAGTQYWIAIGAILVDGNADAWVWSGSSQGDLVNATNFYNGFGFTVFDPTFNDLAFAIVPAPSTALMGLGALSMISRRRR
jgi:hypothetical protein